MLKDEFIKKNPVSKLDKNQKQIKRKNSDFLNINHSRNPAFFHNLLD